MCLNKLQGIHILKSTFYDNTSGLDCKKKEGNLQNVEAVMLKQLV